MKNSKLHTTEDKSNEKVTSSNSKSEDTPDQLAEDIRHYFAPKKVKSFTDTSDQDTIEVPSVKQRDSSQSEPPQDTSLTEITAEYFMATDPDRVALQRKVLAWHKAERAKACKQAREKLFEQIRSAIEGQEVDVEATRERMEELGASENEILNMEIEADDTKEILDGVREALTRLENTDE